MSNAFLLDICCLCWVVVPLRFFWKILPFQILVCLIVHSFISHLHLHIIFARGYCNSYCSQDLLDLVGWWLVDCLPFGSKVDVDVTIIVSVILLHHPKLIFASFGEIHPVPILSHTPNNARLAGRPSYLQSPLWPRMDKEKSVGNFLWLSVKTNPIKRQGKLLCLYKLVRQYVYIYISVCVSVRCNLYLYISSVQYSSIAVTRSVTCSASTEILTRLPSSVALDLALDLTVSGRWHLGYHKKDVNNIKQLRLLLFSIWSRCTKIDRYIQIV